MRTYPLLQSQMGVFLEWRQVPDSTKFNIPVVATFGKEVDPNRLESALRTIFLVRKELRTRIDRDDNGEPCQWIDPNMIIPISRKEMTDEEANCYIDNGFIKPYDLLSGEPLCRTEIIETPEHVYWLWDPQHIIIDGTTHEPNFFQIDIPMAYGGQELLPYDYDIYQHAEKEVQDFSTEAYLNAKQYYQEKFNDCEAVSLSSNTSNPWGNCIRRSAFVNCKMIDEKCIEIGVNSNLLFMAAFSLVLSRFSGKDKITYYTINHGRTDKRLKHAYGMFVKSVPILAELREEQNTIDFIKGFRRELMNSVRYGIYPFTHFCNDLGLYPRISFGFQGESMQEITIIDGREYQLYQPNNGKTDKDVTCIVYIVNGEYDIRIEASDSLYSTEYLQIIADSIKAVVEQMLSNPNIMLSEISTTSTEGQKDIIQLSKGESITYNTDKTFVDIFVERASLCPKDTAVVCNKDEYSYEQLNEVSNRIANQLVAGGVIPGECVGIHLNRCKEFVAAVIGVMKAGSAYTPIDVNYPEDRKKYIIEQSGARTIIDDEWLNKIKACEELKSGSVNLSSPSMPAYIIYTSGTTGNPKGVVVPHRCITACASWLIPEFGLMPGKRNLLQPNLSFDASTFDLFYPLMAGAEVHLLNDQLSRDTGGIAAYIDEKGITGMTMSTAMGMELLNMHDINVEYVMLGGEKFLPVKKTSSRLYNGYGPTEFTVCSSFHLIDQSKDYGYNIPIGRPVPNTYSFICDKSGQLLPKGIVGELCLAGAQIADGYWGKEDLTNERFRDCKFLPDIKLYYTGDLARYNENGELEYIGRKDNQIKLRGYRIEIEEIEKAIQRVSGIKKCIVFDKIIYSNGYKGLICLYESDEIVNESDIERTISSILPAYMLPDVYVRIDRFFYTSNGKIDRKNLPDYNLPRTISKRARTNEERILVDIISEMSGLDIENIGINIKLKYLGIKSIEQGQIVNILYSKYLLNIKYADCNTNSTIEEIALKLSYEKMSTINTVKYKLASNQLAIYHECQKNRGTTMYNIPLCLTIFNSDLDSVCDALTKTITIHPNLLSYIQIEDDDVYALQSDIKDLIISKSVLYEKPTEQFFQNKVRPFDVENESLVRFAIYQYEKNVYVFMDIHHILMDGYSEQIFISDLLKECAGISSTKEFTSVSEYSLEEEYFMSSNKRSKAKLFFKEYLQECTSGIYPYDFTDAGEHKEQIVRHSFNAFDINKFCETNNVTENTFFLVAVSQYLIRYTAIDKLAISTIHHGRTQGRYSNTVGMFVRTFPFVAEHSNDITRAIKNAREYFDRSVSYCLYPFSEICKDNGIKPEIMFSYDTETITDIKKAPIKYHANVLKLGNPKMPLSIAVSRLSKEKFELLIEYDTAYYSSESMESLANNFTYYVQEMALENSIPVRGLVKDSDVSDIIRYSYGGDLPVINKSFVELFCEASKIFGNNIAIKDKNGTLSYEELDNASNNLAKALLDQGVLPNEYVGIYLGHRKDYIIAIIAILRIGATYVPLDSKYPQDRIEKSIKKCGINIIVTSRVLFASNGSELGKLVDTIFVESINSNPCPPINKSNLNSNAYVIFTSGSTGEPKGVLIPNKALSSFIYTIVNLYNLTHTDKIVCHSSYGFDASVEDIFPILTVGGELHCITTEDRKDIDAVAKYIYANGITGGSYSTQFGILLLEQYPQLPVRYLTVGGEKMLRVPTSQCEIYNMYGPTEFTVDATCHKISKKIEYKDIPIGRPILGTYALVLDKDRNILPIGGVGYLYLSGQQMARGYVNDIEQTNNKFVYSSLLNNIAYNTGDLVRWSKEGELKYIGRSDQQIKIRGFRVELGEIETVTSSFTGIKDCVVIAKKHNDELRLCCYYTASKIIEKESLRNFLGERLADYMIPSFFCQVEENEMKTSVSGKIDRKYFSGLPYPEEDRIVPYSPPITDNEKIICEVFANVFHKEDVGANDHYSYDLGGSSITSILLSIRLKKKGIVISSSDIIKYGTPRLISSYLEGAFNDGKDEMWKFDLTKIQNLLDSQNSQSIKKSHSKKKYYLLTGASGFLGIHILQKLLISNCFVTCIVRSKEKLFSNYNWYFDEDLSHFSSQLTIIEKDISYVAVEDIQSQIDCVINCAANVKHYVGEIEKAEQLSTNTHALRNIVNICKKEHALLVQISTVSIAGDSMDSISRSLTERDFNIGQTSNNDYVISKYNAEGIVLDAIASGAIKGKIMRLGNLTSRYYDGKFQINENTNAFTNYIKSIVGMGYVESSLLNMEIELSPIDNVSEAIMQLMDTDDSLIVFHVYNPNNIPFFSIIEVLNNLPNINIEKLSAADFQEIKKELERREKDDILKGLMHYDSTSNYKTHNIVLNRHTEDLLNHLGFEWSELNYDYLKRFLSRLKYN